MLLQMALFHYFLWQTCFPLCVCVCVCVCIYIYTTSSLSIHLSMDIHSPFHVLPVVNSTGVSTGVHVFSQIMVFSGYVPSSGIAGSCDSSLLRTVHTVLHSGCTNSHSHQRCRRVCFLHTLSLLRHSVVSDSATPWAVAHQAPLSMRILQARVLE